MTQQPPKKPKLAARPPPGRVARSTAPGLHVVTLSRPGLEELFITAVPTNRDQPRDVFERAFGAVRQAHATVLAQNVFETPDVSGQEWQALQEVCGEVSWPVTWLVEGSGAHGVRGGTHLHAVAGVNVRRLHLEGRVVGSLFENHHLRQCRLGDLRAADAGLPRVEQARQTFDKMEAALRLAGMDFSHVVRTWLYLDHILAWYNDFNKVRNAFFSRRGVFDGLVPASTGVGGGNAAGAALVADLQAIQPRNGDVQAFAVPSPKQCPALRYGSSFSRAVEIVLPSHRRLLVSGTASIGPGGETIHVGDVAKQIRLTMDVVKAILDSRRMDWSDVVRAIAYLKHGADAEAFTRYCREARLPAMPVIAAENDICREELLFEIELDALQATP